MKKQIKPVIETCDAGHQFARLADHPKSGAGYRCPHCMSMGLDKARQQLDRASFVILICQSTLMLGYDESSGTYDLASINWVHKHLHTYLAKSGA